ncbi:hypothetical protein ACFPPD_10470 [Cohnella suwonensis]|uniref:Butirosin biosynthesis protein H N-terminal domain-containing protein n=1 Tax=Cohnella suwonensis TaxID=696072 RepID=A0ABW0LTB0_9BACL
MTAKRLPLSDHDYVTYPNVAHLFSVIGNREETMPWVYTNFIQLVYFESLRKIDYTNKTDSFFDPLLFDCPWLNIQFTHRDTISQAWNGSIVQFAIDSIDRGNYIYFVADQYYIRASAAYGNHTHNHDMFIYGYDKTTKKLNIADNLKYGKYIRTTCGFDEMEMAYAHADPDRDWFDSRVMSFAFKPKTYFQYERYLVFDSVSVVHSLNRYIHSMKPASYMCLENTYGIAVYERVHEYLLALKQEREVIDIRLLHILYEHKKMMRRRIRYMLQHGYLADENLEASYANVEKEHEICVGLMLKFMITGDDKLLDRISGALMEAAVIEKELLGRVIATVSHRQVFYKGRAD